MVVYMFELRNVEVFINNRRILHNVNFSANNGEFHIILGPNASGKTSLLNAIMGIKPYMISKGNVIFMGYDITHEPPHIKARKGLALAHQLPPSIKGLLVKSFIEELIKRYSTEKSYIELLSSILDIKGLMNKYLFTDMSGGERKRLETFLTFLMKPKVIMLDEPDSGVDIESLNKIADVIKIALKMKIIVILVTHSLHMLKILESHINSVHIIYGGTIMCSGTYSDIIPLIEKYGFSQAITELLARS